MIGWWTGAIYGIEEYNDVTINIQTNIILCFASIAITAENP